MIDIYYLLYLKGEIPMHKNKFETALIRGAAKATVVCANSANKALSTKVGKSIMSYALAASVLTVNAYASDGTAQGVLDSIMNVLGPGVIALGSLVAVVGGVQLGTAFTRQDASSKTEGFMALVGGAIIAGVGALITGLNINFGA